MEGKAVPSGIEGTEGLPHLLLEVLGPPELAAVEVHELGEVDHTITAGLSLDGLNLLLERGLACSPQDQDVERDHQ